MRIRTNFDERYEVRRNIIEEVFKKFKKENIRFIVLRNYENIAEEKDVDFVVENNSRQKLKRILEEFGLRKGIDFKYYLSYKNEKVWFDIRVGGIIYNGFLYKDFEELYFKRRRLKKFYVLSKEDELIHLVLHSIVDKGLYKEKYVVKIEALIRDVDKEKISKELEKKFGKYGEKLIFYLEKGKYEKSLGLKWKLILGIFSVRDLFVFLVINLVRIFR